MAMSLPGMNLYETVAFSEVDPQACVVLKKRFPLIPNLGDVSNIKPDEVPEVDVIAGGFPCQDLSVGGRGAGLTGKRSGLWFEMLRLIEVKRPLGVLIENVDILRKRGLDVVLEGLAGAGYDAEWYTVRASAVGAPHRRKRLYIIAYRKRPRGPRLEPPLSLRKSGQWNWSGKEDLQAIVDSPFLAGPCWPQPLLRGVDDGLAGRSHRLRLIGNGVVIPVVAQMAVLLYSRITE